MSDSKNILKSLKTLNEQITTSKWWIMLFRVISWVMLFTYVLRALFIWTSETLIGYGSHIWHSPIFFTNLFILIYTSDIEDILVKRTAGTDAKAPTPMTFATKLLMAVLLVGNLITLVLFMSKWGQDATLCDSVRKGTYNWALAPRNGTASGLDGGSRSPIVCLDPYYGQWICIVIVNVVQTLGTLIQIGILGVTIWGLMTTYEKWYKSAIKREKGDYAEIGRV
jgi:hypothetical protein